MAVSMDGRMAISAVGQPRGSSGMAPVKFSNGELMGKKMMMNFSQQRVVRNHTNFKGWPVYELLRYAPQHKWSAFLQFPSPNSNHKPQPPSKTSHSILPIVNKTITTPRNFKSTPSLPLFALSLPFFFNPQDALASGGEYGILEGRSLALVHPIVMGALFAYTLYAGYLGWQWRRVRTLQNEINELKKQQTPTPVTPDGTPLSSPSPIETKIQLLSEERKELIKGSYREKHFNAGSILLAFGVFESIGGGVNTYLRTGKLFPGPHLYAGAAITVLWAAAAALVPPMQKGSETARNLHIALNVVNVLLFVWQIPTGWDIVLKVFEFTNWP